MFPEEKRMSARVRFSDGEEPEAQLELEPELANRLFQALLWIQNMWSVCGTNILETLEYRMQCWDPDPQDPLVFGPPGSGTIS
jgi:hypothetical protein